MLLANGVSTSISYKVRTHFAQRYMEQSAVDVEQILMKVPPPHTNANHPT